MHDRAASPLHRQHDVAGIGDGRGKGPVLLRIRRLVVEPDVEGDGARLQRLEGGEHIDVGLPRERVFAVLRDRGVVDRNDGDLVAQLAR